MTKKKLHRWYRIHNRHIERHALCMSLRQKQWNYHKKQYFTECMPETRRASSLLSDKRKELTCIILWVQQINLMRTKTKSHPKPKRVLLKESTRQNFPFIYFVRSPNRRNAKYFLACLSRKFIISWLSLWPQPVLWIISVQGIQEMKLVYWHHIKFSIKTKLFVYFGLVCISLFCFENNDENGKIDDLAASSNEFKWETLRNYSIERSKWAFVRGSNYVENFSASEWK